MPSKPRALRSRLPLLSALLVAAMFGAHGTARADPPPATSGDRSVLQGCLDLVSQNLMKGGAVSETEAPGPAGRLAGAVKAATTRYESCIGAVSIPCQQEPGGEATLGMIECIQREWAVWDERLNRIYREQLKDAEPKLATALRETQRAWLKWREKSARGLPSTTRAARSSAPCTTRACWRRRPCRRSGWSTAELQAVDNSGQTHGPTCYCLLRSNPAGSDPGGTPTQMFCNPRRTCWMHVIDVTPLSL